MVELDYWRIKSALLGLQLEENQLLQSLNEVRSKRLALLNENNLEENVHYRFNDKEFTIEKVNGK